jgi:hypothetical protein
VTDNDPLYLGFTRRRRFLVGVSLALATAGFLGLRIEEVDVLGNKAQVGDPDRILLVGYLVWLWALWTYIQWFNDYGAWEKTKAAFVEARDRLLLKMLGTVEAEPDRLTNYRDPILKAAANSFTADHKPLAEQLFFTARAGSVQRNRNDELIIVCSLQCWLPLFPSGEQNHGSPDLYTVPVKTRAYVMSAVRASVELILSTRYFTEYFAPFLIAVAPRFSSPCDSFRRRSLRFRHSMAVGE